MNTEDLSTLGERALAVEGRPDERLDEVHRRIDRARRNRQRAAVVATVVAIVLVLMAGTALLTQQDPRSLPPTTPTGPTPTPQVEDSPSVRRLAYATGQTIHWGDRVIDVGGEVPQLTATDDGVVFIRAGGKEPDNCSGPQGCFGSLWFTEGSEVVRIGRVSGSWVRGYQVRFSTAGSTVVWFEPDPHGRLRNSNVGVKGEYVVYDTGERREVARMGSAGRDPDRQGHSHLVIEGVFDDYVYWIPDDRDGEWCREYSKPGGMCLHHRAVMRLDVGTGTQAKVPWPAYVGDRLSRPRMFFASTYTADYPYNPTPGDHPGEEGVGVHRDGDRLVADYYGGSGAVTVRRAGTDERVRLRPPAGYHAVNDFFMVAWLDDARVVLMADNKDDLLICRLPDGRCRVAAKGPLYADFGGRG